MKYYDIACFEVNESLQKRLGYAKVFSTTKDIALLESPRQVPGHSIIVSDNPSILSKSVREGQVIGIAFKNNVLIRKAVEAAAESGKKVFVPVSAMVSADPSARNLELSKIRKIVSASHSLKASVVMVTLASSPAFLLSTAQMSALSGLIVKNASSKFSMFGGELYDN